MNRSTILVIALLAAVCVACSKPPSEAESLNHKANLAYQGGDYGGALEQYRRAEVLRPDLPAISYNAGNALINQSDFQNAISEEKRAALSTDPTLQDRAYYSMGTADVRLNQLREAVDAYKSALRANPSDVDAKYNLEVVQRRLAQEQAREQQVQNQPTATPPPSPTPGPTRPSTPIPQPGGAQPTGTPQPGPGQPGQPGQGPPGQPNQASQPGQASQPPQNQPGQATPSAAAGAGQGGTPPTGANNTASGFTGTAPGEADALTPDIRNALSQFDQSQSIDDALRALNLIGQQEQLRQSERQSGGQSQGRDW